MMNINVPLLYMPLLYMVLMNMAAFAIMGFDKRQAVKGRRRVPERRLLILAAAGGALGVWTGMRCWRHKTKHLVFVYGIPGLFLWNLLAIWGVYSMWRF